MSKTREKLDSARFFLDQLKAIEQPMFEEQLRIFQYYLEAFLTALRSVTKLPVIRDTTVKNFVKYDWFLEKEFGSNSGFVAWYDSKALALSADKVFSFFKEQRDITVHFSNNKSVEMSKNINLNLADSEGSYDSVTVQLIHEGGTKEPPFTSTTKPTPTGNGASSSVGFSDLKFQNFPSKNNDVIVCCETQYMKVVSIVGECEALFSP